MKRLLPLLFLLPSIALIIHARKQRDDTAEVETYPVHFVVTTGSYVLPNGYRLEVWRDGTPLFAEVVDGRATLEFEREGATKVMVHVAAGTTFKSSLSAGQPVEITVERGSEPQLEKLVVTRKECESAIAKLEAAR